MKIRKNITFYICSWIMFVFLLVSCDSGFDAINTDQTRVTTVEPVLQLNTAVISSTLSFSNLLCETTIVRQGVSPFPGVLTCANLNQDNKGQTSTNWNRHFGTNVIRELTYAINSSDPNSNIHNILRIWRAYAFMVVTDSYGDAPYSEAGAGFPEGVVFTAYDSQESIYTGNGGILEELSQATAALDIGQDVDDRDLLYDGDIIQWSRLGNSLLFRAAMRLSKANPTLAADYVDIAVSGPGGLMQSNDDNAVVRHTSDYRNAVGNALTGGESPNYYLDEFFVNYLQNNDDPRLGSIAVRYPGASGGGDQTEATADRDPENQIGMPQGYDNTTITPVASAAGLTSFFSYSQLDRTTLTSSFSPTFFVTFAQTQLLLAEAVVRGWADGDAGVLYENGIEAHMQQLADYGERATISQSDINAYIQANPLDLGQPEDGILEDINTQYWVASLLNGPEAWANFRRSGYPVLQPNPFPASELQTEDFIRRFTYPDSEYSVNTANLNEAIGRQGTDNLETRIWWDIE